MTDHDPAEPDCPLNEEEGKCNYQPQWSSLIGHSPLTVAGECPQCERTCQCALISKVLRRGQGAGDDAVNEWLREDWIVPPLSFREKHPQLVRLIQRTGGRALRSVITSAHPVQGPVDAEAIAGLQRWSMWSDIYGEVEAEKSNRGTWVKFSDVVALLSVAPTQELLR